MEEVVADGFIVVGPPVEVDSGRARLLKAVTLFHMSVCVTFKNAQPGTLVPLGITIGNVPSELTLVQLLDHSDH